jgi:hypothetical protein
MVLRSLLTPGGASPFMPRYGCPVTPAELIERVRALASAGTASFEALVAACLAELTGRGFALQKTGSQHGRDLGDDRSGGPRVFVECKRYRWDTELNQRELLGETDEAVREPDLDVWVLVTSRPASDSLRDTLRSHLDQFGVDFVAIALGDGTPSSLEVLLASAPDAVARALAPASVPADVLVCLEGIRALPGFDLAKKRLPQLLEHEAVGLDGWKARQKESLDADLHDPDRSLARFRQRIDLASFIQRPQLVRQLDEWSESWKTVAAVTPLVVIGEEGDGKTWVTASWVNQRTMSASSFPAALMVNGAALGDRSLIDIVVDAATSRPTSLPEYGQATRDRIRRRVARWASAAQSGQPPFLLLLDGMDDGPSAETLRALIAQSKVDLPTIPLLITVRSQFWQEALEPLTDLNVRPLPVGPFDDGEFAEALSMKGLNADDLAPELMPLLRKPRYLDLAARFQDRMIASGDLTVARLKYEDWKDRYERKAGTINDSMFQQVLVRLAQDARASDRGSGRRELMDVLPTHGSDKALNDLCTSGVLDRNDDGRFTVSETRLPLAMGLLLASDVRRACKNGQDAYNVASRALEQEDGRGITAAAAECAALVGLLDPTFPLKGGAALLRTWLERQQRAQHTQKAFTGYVRARAEAYGELAQAVWQSGQLDRHEQEQLVMGALLGARDHPHVLDTLRPYFDRWLSFAPRTDDVAGDAPEDVRNRERERLQTLLGPVSPDGTVVVSGRELRLVEPGMMRLARVALAVISHVDRRPHIRAIATALLVDVITRLPRRHDVIPWVLRTAPDDIEATVLAEADALAATSTVEGPRTARRLLYALDTRAADERARPIIADAPAQKPLSFPWSEGDYVGELAKESRLAVVSRGLSIVGLNPSLEIPPIGAGFAPLLEPLDPSVMWRGASQTIEEHMLDEAEVVFARTDPRPLAAFYRKVAKTTGRRIDEDLIALCWALLPNALLLDGPAIEELEAAWRRVVESYDGRKDVESTLFRLLLQFRRGQAQVDLLMKRPDDAPDYLSFEGLFRGDPDWTAVATVLSTGTTRQIARTAWYLSALAGTTPAEVAGLLIGHAADPDRYVRLMVLRWALSQDEVTAAAVVARWTPPSDIEADEKNAAGLLLARSRTDPRSAPGLDPISSAAAVRARGLSPEELAWYANEISASIASASGTAKPWTYSRVALAKTRDRTAHLRNEGLTLVGRSEKMVANWATWGGLPMATAERFALLFDPATRACLHGAEMQEADRARAAESAAHRRLFDEAPDLDLMTAIDATHPGQVATWVSSALTRPGRGSKPTMGSLLGLYHSVCIAGFRNGRAWAVDLCRALADAEPRWVDGRTGVSWATRTAWEPGNQRDTIDRYRDELLRSARTDRRLCELVVAAEQAGLRPTLLRLIQGMQSDQSRLVRACAVAALGFTSDPDADRILERQSTGTDPWLDEIASTSVRRRQLDAWARHWFDVFLRGSGDEEAWGAFRLFARCVDMRYVVWKPGRQSLIDALSDRRRAYLIANEKQIFDAIKKRAATAKKTLAGYSVLEREVWPWMPEGAGE